MSIVSILPLHSPLNTPTGSPKRTTQNASLSPSTQLNSNSASPKKITMVARSTFESPHAVHNYSPTQSSDKRRKISGNNEISSTSSSSSSALLIDQTAFSEQKSNTYVRSASAYNPPPAPSGKKGRPVFRLPNESSTSSSSYTSGTQSDRKPVVKNFASFISPNENPHGQSMFTSSTLSAQNHSISPFSFLSKQPFSSPSPMHSSRFTGPDFMATTEQKPTPHSSSFASPVRFGDLNETTDPLSMLPPSVLFQEPDSETMEEKAAKKEAAKDWVLRISEYRNQATVGLKKITQSSFRDIYESKNPQDLFPIKKFFNEELLKNQPALTIKTLFANSRAQYEELNAANQKDGTSLLLPGLRIAQTHFDEVNGCIGQEKMERLLNPQEDMKNPVTKELMKNLIDRLYKASQNDENNTLKYVDFKVANLGWVKGQLTLFDFAEEREDKFDMILDRLLSQLAGSDQELEQYLDPRNVN